MSCGPPADPQNVESLQQPSSFQMDPDRHGHFILVQPNFDEFLAEKQPYLGWSTLKTIHPRAAYDQN